MLTFKNVKLCDSDVLRPFYTATRSCNSSLNLVNMMMWKEALDLKYAIENDVLYYDMHWEGDCRLLFPPMPMTSMGWREILQPVLDTYRNGCEIIFRCMDDKHKKGIEDEFGDFFKFEPDRDNYDYLYNASDLMTYSGKKFHGKRNHVNNLLQNYSPEVLPYDDTMLEECWQLYIHWYENKDSEATGMDFEPQATRFVMEKYKETGMQGCVVKLYGKIEAFAFGQQITDDMALIHVEKANASINGLYPYIAQQFVVKNFSHLAYINRMEDDGIEGLRKAKLSLRPTGFVEKYTMTLNYDI